jgi:hypothetical protein
MRHFSLLVLLAAACGACPSTAWAGWGCGAAGTDGSVTRVWAAQTEGEASQTVLKNCAETGTACKIISCQVGVDTQDEAHKVWPLEGRVTNCFGSGNCNLGYKPY